MEAGFEYAADWLKKQPGMEHIDLGILKVANVQFFGAFKRAYEEAGDGRKLLLMGVKMADAVREIMDQGWIRFCPEINLKKLLELAAPALSALDPMNKAAQKMLGGLPV